MKNRHRIRYLVQRLLSALHAILNLTLLLWSAYQCKRHKVRITGGIIYSQIFTYEIFQEVKPQYFYLPHSYSI